MSTLFRIQEIDASKSYPLQCFMGLDEAPRQDAFKWVIIGTDGDIYDRCWWSFDKKNGDNRIRALLYSPFAANSGSADFEFVIPASAVGGAPKKKKTPKKVVKKTPKKTLMKRL